MHRGAPPPGLTRTRPPSAQFVDLCILCGCDYLPSVRGVGPKKALQGIKKFGSLEAFLDSLDATKFVVRA